jgi:hypothetical protein
MVVPLKTSRFVAISVFVVLICLIFVFSPLRAEAAASIYISPPSGTFAVGGTFNISVFVNTGGQSINAIKADMSFPPDKLQIISPSAGKSFVSVWVNQPSYSNADGNLTFEGGIPNPGINTDAGLISTITFRVKSTGMAAVKILDSSHVFLNDGRGTDILGQISDGIYYLTLPPPQGPIITSRTNPDQEKWYSEKLVSLEWTSPPDIQGYSYVLDQNPMGEPDGISEGINTRVVYDNVADGIHYFHIKALRWGAWGGVTDYAIKIDSSPPAAFKINLSPGSVTSNHRPIIDMRTTDVVSGIDHYELKIIALDPPAALLPQNSTPFFIEVQPPYSPELDNGRYDIIARAYDEASNYCMAEAALTIAPPIFELIGDKGLKIEGLFTLGWPYVGIIAAILLIGLAYFFWLVWKCRRQIEKILVQGIRKHPYLSRKLEELRKKQDEYGSSRPPRGNAGGAGIMTLLLVTACAGLFMLSNGVVRAAQTDAASNVSLTPPLVTLFPDNISNDEILYVGGRSDAPSAWVMIHLQDAETGAVTEQAARTDKTGAWFFAFPQFLEAGHYILWTQLKVGEDLSPPSSKVDLTVAPTAVQIGNNRLSYQGLYLVLFLLFLVAFSVLLICTLYHWYHFRRKRRKLNGILKDAEESIVRGFALLRRDIEDELNLIRRAKLKKELSAEEKLREEKLLKDLEDVNRYVGKEIWEVEKAQKRM